MFCLNHSSTDHTGQQACVSLLLQSATQCVSVLVLTKCRKFPSLLSDEGRMLCGLYCQSCRGRSVGWLPRPRLCCSGSLVYFVIKPHHIVLLPYPIVTLLSAGCIGAILSGLRSLIILCFKSAQTGERLNCCNTLNNFFLWRVCADPCIIGSLNSRIKSLDSHFLSLDFKILRLFCFLHRKI